MPKSVNKTGNKTAALNGAMAGLVSSMILQPLEVLKINLILLPNQMKTLKNTGFLRSFKEASKIVYNTEGTLGFFRGLTPAVVRSVAAATIFFYSLNKIDSALKKRVENKNFVDFISSASARTLSSVLTNPFTVMKTRAGMIGNDQYSSVLRNFRLIYRAEGLGGFFKGSVAMIVRDFPFGGVFYLVYNTSNKILKNYSDSSLVYFTSGMVAGVTATAMTQPLEIVKAQLMANTKRVEAGSRISIFSSLTAIYQKEGIKGYSRGLLPRMLRKPVINAATFFFYEVFSKMGKKEKQTY